jgi:hypothetical protein
VAQVVEPCKCKKALSSNHSAAKKETKELQNAIEQRVTLHICDLPFTEFFLMRKHVLKGL